MLTKRVIPCLDVKDGRVVKGVNFVSLRDAGDPVELARATARVSARSKPALVPSRSMLVSRISPAPRRAASAAQATASMPVALRPPCT